MAVGGLRKTYQRIRMKSKTPARTEIRANYEGRRAGEKVESYTRAE